MAEEGEPLPIVKVGNISFLILPLVDALTGTETVALHQCALRQIPREVREKGGMELLSMVVDAMGKIYGDLKEIGNTRKTLEKYGCSDLAKKYGIG
jgi:hypothetical protein